MLSLKYITTCVVALYILSHNMQKWKEHECNGYRLIIQENGITLGYSPESGIKIIYKDGH